MRMMSKRYFPGMLTLAALGIGGAVILGRTAMLGRAWRKLT